MDKMSLKKEEWNESLQKYPKLAARMETLSEVWAETFPNAQRDIKRRQEQRKKNAKEARETQEKMKDMTPEELEELEKSTPEWKRHALVVTEQ